MLYSVISNNNNYYFIFRNKFEFEYQNFIDGIVGATFEYVCQFIIKNSMDNIKRTQNALNSISMIPNASKYYYLFFYIDNSYEYSKNC